MKIEYGKLGGDAIVALANASGMAVTLCARGAGIVSVKVPDKNGKATEVTKLPESGYGNYHGALIGRTAGRVENAEFTIDGRTARLDKNNFGVDNLHGGSAGFNFKTFDFTVEQSVDFTDVKFTYDSPDGEGGYFGNALISAVYRVYENINGMDIFFGAEPDCKTLFNMTNHVYWDMSGGKTPVTEQEMYINASRVGELNERLILQKFVPVNRAFDFRTPRKMGEYIKEECVLRYTNGYDHPFYLDARGADKVACSLYSSVTSIKLEVSTSYPCVVVYGDNYDGYASVCFECQFPPNGLKLQPDDCGVCDPEHPYGETMRYRFSVK